jgi:hypothetical protein
MNSGSEVVAAAIIPPVGSYVRAFRVTRDRTSAPRHGPLYLHRAAQAVQKFRVFSRAAETGVPRCTNSSCEACQVRTKDFLWPADTVNSPTVDRSSPRR